MKLEFLYTDESYKEKIKDIKIGDSVTLSHTDESNLYIFSYEIKGENNFVSFFIKDVFLAICIIPFHKQIVPKNVTVKLTADSADSNIPLLTSAILPVKIA